MTTIFGELERLITEHGSAAILRERLGLAADQYTALEKKNSGLQAENENLRAQLEHLQKENAELKQAIPRDAGRLGAFDRDTHKVLSLFFQQSDDVSVDQIAMQIGLDRSMVEYHFDLLREAGLAIGQA